MNFANYQKILSLIKTYPELWSQENRLTGYRKGFIDHAAAFGSGKDLLDPSTVIYNEARIYLGLGLNEVTWLSVRGRTISDYEEFLEAKFCTAMWPGSHIRIGGFGVKFIEGERKLS